MQYAHATGETLSRTPNPFFGPSEHAELQKAVQLILNLDETLQHHGLDSAQILMEQGFGKATVIGAILSELPAPTALEAFDTESVLLARSVAKIKTLEEKNRSKIPYKHLQKIVLGLADDARTILILIAKKLAELRFLSEQPAEEQSALCEHALMHWVPVIHKLGLHKVRWEIEDLAMKKLLPKEYAAIKTRINDKRNQRHQKTEDLVNRIKEELEQARIHAVVYGRVKNFYRVYKKMKEKECDFGEIHDLIGCRIICSSVNECYETLAVIQNALKTHTSGFDDYVAKPKKTGYRSIHLNLDWKKVPSEIQIRTWDMHKDAEDGFAAHWEYKQYQKDPHFDRAFAVTKQLADWFSQTTNKDLMDSLNLRFEKNKIFVLTPKNDLIALPMNATPIDFAFAVHTDLGYKCEKARVNGKPVSLSHLLENGDCVEIQTSDENTVKQNWLSFVQTEKAKQKIRSILQLKPQPTRATVKKILQPTLFQKHANLIPARCCTPLPGDEIIGYKTTKRKIKIHRADCPNAARIPADHQMFVTPERFNQNEFETSFKVFVQNRAGALSDVLTAIASTSGKIISTESVNKHNSFIWRFRIKTKNRKTLEKTFEQVGKVKGVDKIER